MNKYRIKINGHIYEAEIEVMDGQNESAPAEKPTPAKELKSPNFSPMPAGAKPQNAAPAKGAVCSSLPGIVTKILVNEGERVKAGQAVLILEAMKMENEIAAPADGILDRLAVGEGAHVAAGVPLFAVVPEKG